MQPSFSINGRAIGAGHPCYIIAEMSANHGQDFQMAVDLIKAAKNAGADAVKLQTYTPDTLTIDCDNSYFQIEGTIWDGKNLYELYQEAYTPWEWQPKLQKVAAELGLDLFSTPFDETAVNFLESMDVPAYKIASFENVDLILLRKVAQTGKPIIMSTGMATLGEVDEAVHCIRTHGGHQLALLKCCSSYPAPPQEMHLSSIPHLSQAFGVPVGLSDHTLDLAVPVAAVAIGACIVEKHFTLSRNAGGPDSAFSLEPKEFKEMVEAVRVCEQAMGHIHYGLNEREEKSRTFRRSLFVVDDIKAGEAFTEVNIRSIRPGHGLHTRHFCQVLGRRASQDIDRGTPLDWSLIAGV